jgi:hypothetical protein
MFKVKNRFQDETPGAGAAAAPVTPVAGAPAGTPSAAATAPPTGETLPAKGYWPDDWTKEIADGDETLIPRAARYTSPKEVFKALVATQNKIRSGEFKSALPKDAKPEEIAEWRKENGIPESHDKYDLKLDNGVVIGKEDDAIIGGFLKAAHAKNYTPDQVKSAVQWYYEEQERATEARQQKDEVEKAATTDALNIEWGSNYRRNINMIENLLAQFPDDVRDKLAGGRLADGTAIFNSPSVLKGFAQLALEVNPASTLVPKGGDVVKTVDDEIAGIEKAMRTNRSEYNKDQKMQERYRELLVAREKIKERKR